MKKQNKSFSEQTQKKLFSENELSELKTLIDEFKNGIKPKHHDSNRAYYKMEEICDSMNKFIVHYDNPALNQGLQVKMNSAFGNSITYDLMTKFADTEELEMADKLMKELVDRINKKFSTGYLAPSSINDNPLPDTKGLKL